MGNCLCAQETISINGKSYIIRDHLDDGGFSTIILVEDSISHQTYVLKKILCHSDYDLEIAEKEIMFHKKLVHPNISKCVASSSKVAVSKMGSPVTEVLMIMPYYQRGTLSNELLQRMTHKNYLSECQVLSVFHDVCLGIEAMHSASPPLAHRDIKTANVVLDGNFIPVIIDLGSAQEARIVIEHDYEARQLQDYAAERCSMPYRAPELFHVESNCSIDERTDIWSLGCLLYALCFFKSPYDFVYERGDSVALAVVSGNIPFPNSHPFSQDTVDLVRWLMQINPADRPFIAAVLEKVNAIRSKIQTDLAV